MASSKMNFSDCKAEFIETWGKLAINWGENRTTGIVHALLLISCEPLCADQIMEELDISRGSANNTLHRLLELNLVFKKDLDGDRKDYYVAEKNMWQVIKAVVQERKKKELDPMIETLEKLSALQPSCSKSEEFHHTVKEIQDFSLRADRILETFTGSEMNWLMRSINLTVKK